MLFFLIATLEQAWNLMRDLQKHRQTTGGPSKVTIENGRNNYISQHGRAEIRRSTAMAAQ
jgi:hypothetical protein